MRPKYILGVVAGCLLFSATAFAHHAVTGFYDPQKTVMLKGVVTKFDWSNPHSFIYLDVKDQSGKIENWALEGNSPGKLNRAGLKKDTLKVGDMVTVEAWLPREGANVAGTLAATPQAADRLKTAKLAHARDVTTPSGMKLAFGR